MNNDICKYEITGPKGTQNGDKVHAYFQYASQSHMQVFVAPKYGKVIKSHYNPSRPMTITAVHPNRIFVIFVARSVLKGSFFFTTWYEQLVPDPKPKPKVDPLTGKAIKSSDKNGTSKSSTANKVVSKTSGDMKPMTLAGNKDSKTEGAGGKFVVSENYNLIIALAVVGFLAQGDLGLEVLDLLHGGGSLV